MDTQETIQKLVEDVAGLKEEMKGVFRHIRQIQADVQSHCHVRETEKTSPTNFCNAIIYGPQQRMTRCLQDFGHGGLHDGEEPKRAPEAGKTNATLREANERLQETAEKALQHQSDLIDKIEELRQKNNSFALKVHDLNRKIQEMEQAEKNRRTYSPCNESLEALRGGLYRIETCILPGGHLEKHQSLEDLQEKISTVNQDNQRLEKERDVFQKENYKLRGSLIHHIQRIVELEGLR